jgi:hypothetical protein
LSTKYYILDIYHTPVENSLQQNYILRVSIATQTDRYSKENRNFIYDFAHKENMFIVSGCTILIFLIEDHLQ